MLYVFQWLGYPELTVPRVLDNPALFMQFDDRRVYTVLALVLLAVIVIVSRMVERTRFGMSLIAIKQNEAAADAAGVDVLAWKLRAIALSGAIAGAVGSFYAVVILVITPNSAFGMLVSAQALTVAMFGGVGTVWGPIIGAAFLIPIAEIAARRARLLPAGHPGRRLRRGDHRPHHRSARGRVLEAARRLQPPRAVRRDTRSPARRCRARGLRRPATRSRTRWCSTSATCPRASAD